MKLMHASLAAVVVVTGVLLNVTDAHATWSRVHASGCFPLLQNNIPSSPAFWINSNWTMENIDLSTNELMCPVSDTSTLQRFQYKTVNVETWASGGVSAALCEDQWNGSGGSCTNLVGTNGSGHQTIFLGGLVGTNGTWTQALEGNFGFIYLKVGSGSEVRGFFFST